MSDKFVIGVTGGIGSGKSAVCREFEHYGATVVDADVVAREVVEPGSDGLAQILEHFGPQVLADDGTLDRAALRKRIFANSDERIRLEKILHPKIRGRIVEQIDLAQGPYCLLCVPLLIERGSSYKVDRILVVDCPTNIQIERVSHRDNISEAEVLAIMATQATREERLAKADDVVDNVGPLEELKDKVAELHELYSELASSS